MTTEASNDHEVWVDDYVTRSGTHVAGHWRKRTPGRGNSVASDAAALATETSRDQKVADSIQAVSHRRQLAELVNGASDSVEKERLRGILNSRDNDAIYNEVVAQRARVGQQWSGDQVRAANEAAQTREDRLQRGMEALRRRREALGQAHGESPASQREQERCPTCGEFKAQWHTCSAGEGKVAHPDAAAAVAEVDQAHGDVVVPECGTTTAPYQPAEVAEHRATIDQQHVKIFGEQRAMDGFRPDIVSGEGSSTDVQVTQTRQRVDPYDDPSPEPPGYITITPPGQNRYKHEQMYAWPRRERPEDIFGPGSTVSEYDTYEEAAQAAAEAAAAARHGAKRCGGCGRYVPIEGEHSCPASTEQETVTTGDAEPPYDGVTVDGVKVGETRHVDLGDSAGSDRCPDCGQYRDSNHTCPTPEGLPDGNYADLKGDERVKAMVADLETSVKAIVESGQLDRWLDAMASNGLNRWSANNRLLATVQMLQRGESLEGLHMMGFRQWEKLNRKVNKGSKAIWILAPVTRKLVEEEDDGTKTEKHRVVGFKSVPVFNVSDTHGDPLPESPVRPAPGEATPGTLEGLRDRVGQAGFSYGETEIPGCRPETGDGTLGYTDPKSKRIVVDSRLSNAQKASTIAHELGHVHCGHVDGDYSEYRKHRGRMETEAEAVAFMVSRSRGATREQTESFSPGYIASWSKGDPAVIHAALDRAVRAHSKIMEGDWPTGGSR